MWGRGGELYWEEVGSSVGGVRLEFSRWERDWEFVWGTSLCLCGRKAGNLGGREAGSV